MHTGRSPAFQATPRLALAGVAAVVLSSGALLLVGGGNPALSFAPLLLIVTATTLLLAPMRVLMLALLATGLVVDIPAERPASGHWRSPFYGVGSLLYDNLNNVLDVPSLRFSGLDVIVVVLVLLVALRLAYGHRGDAAGRLPVASPMTVALAIAFVAVAWLELWGLARGGDFRNSLWQIRQLLWLPVLGALFNHALRGPADFALVGRIVVGAACAKVALGLYFLLAIARPQGLEAPYVTSHGDSVLFVVACAICVARWLQRPSLGHLALNLTATPWLLLGISINNRRLAFVSLFGALAVMYVLLEGRTKRALTLTGLALLPLLLVYLAIGTKRSTGIFAPASAVVSVLSQSDASSATRDIENYNLLQTLKQAPLAGSGFGHEYLEISRAYDISHAFAQYRFIAHNSVLWLWSIGGLVGFTAIWLLLAVTVFLAARAYRCGRDWRDRLAATFVLAVVVAWLVQAWGDMGSQSWVGTLLLSVSFALAGKLAVATGAWPAPVRQGAR